MISSIIKNVTDKVYDAYKTASEKAKSSEKEKSTPTVNEHQKYIEDKFAGGYDDYKRIQQERYNAAYNSKDYDLMSRLDEDAKKVGYYLTPPTSNTTAQNSYQNQLSNPYESYMDSLNQRYEDINKQIAEKNNAAVQQGVTRLQNQIPGLNEGYDNAARQAYISNMQSRRTLPQQLAIQGATGGASETAMLGLDTTYQNNLNNINTQRQNSINDVNNAITDLKNSGDLATADQIMQNNQSALSAYQNMMNNSASYQQWLANFNANRDHSQWNKEYQTGRDTINDNRYNNEYADSQKQQEYNNILNRLSMGLISPNDAVSLGGPTSQGQEYVNRLIASQNADIANKISITNNRNTQKAESENNPITTANKYLAQGNRVKAIEALSAVYSNEQIKQYLESQGYRTNDIDWGIIENPASLLPNVNVNRDKMYQNPVLSTETMINFLRSQGLSSEEIAARLNR